MRQWQIFSAHPLSAPSWWAAGGDRDGILGRRRSAEVYFQTKTKDVRGGTVTLESGEVDTAEPLSERRPLFVRWRPVCI